MYWEFFQKHSVFKSFVTLINISKAPDFYSLWHLGNWRFSDYAHGLSLRTHEVWSDLSQFQSIWPITKPIWFARGSYLISFKRFLLSIFLLTLVWRIVKRRITKNGSKWSEAKKNAKWISTVLFFNICLKSST